MELEEVDERYMLVSLSRLPPVEMSIKFPPAIPKLEERLPPPRPRCLTDDDAAGVYKVPTTLTSLLFS